MNWKSFFTPDMKKAALFAGLLIIYSFLPLFPVHDVVLCVVGPCPPIFLFTSLSAAVMHTGFDMLASDYLIFIAELLVLYLVACAVTSNIPKNRRKK